MRRKPQIPVTQSEAHTHTVRKQVNNEKNTYNFTSFEMNEVYTDRKFFVKLTLYRSLTL